MSGHIINIHFQEIPTFSSTLHNGSLTSDIQYQSYGPHFEGY